MKFRVDIGGDEAGLQYMWRVTAGTIKAGQGSREITVATRMSMATDEVVATIDIFGLPAGCKSTLSESALLFREGHWDWDLDAYGILKPNEERGRLDQFFAELANNPTLVGLILLQITKRERRDVKNRRLQFILKHVRYRHFDQSRLLFALEFADRPRTIPVRIPPDGDLPPCKNCLIIKGSDIR